MRRRYISILVGVGVAAIGIGLVAFDLWRSRQRELDDAGRATRNLAFVLAAHTMRTIEAVDQVLDGLARDGEAAALDTPLDAPLDAGRAPAALETRLRDRVAALPQIHWLNVIDAGGRVVASSTATGRALGGLADRDFIVAARATDRLVIGTLLRSRRADQWFVGMARRIRTADGRFVGVVAAALDPAYFAGLYSQIDVGPGSNVSLFHRDATFIARWPDHDGFVGRSIASGALFREHLPKAPSGTIRLETVVGGREILLSYVAIDGTPFVINVAVDLVDMLAEWRRSLAVYIVVALGIVGLTLIAVLLALRSERRTRELRLIADRTLREDERRAAETASRRQFQDVLDLMFGFVGLFDRSGAIIEVNRAALEVAGLTREQVVGRPLWEAPWWTHSSEEQARLRAALGRAAAGEFVRYEASAQVLAGTITVDVVFGPLRDAAGDVVSLVGFGVDVTERHRVEDSLRRSQDMLSGVLGISPEAIIIAGRDLRVRMFSNGAEQIFGYTAHEVIGGSIERLIPQRFRDAHAGHVVAFADAGLASRRMGERGEIVALRKSGEEFPAEASISKLATDDGLVFTVVLRDISAAKKAQRELSEAKDRAEAANMAKTLFIANMSHELRTPLNAIIGFAQMLLLKPDAARVAEYSGYIERSGLHLLGIVNNILDISQIEVGKTRLDARPASAAELIDGALNMVGDLARKGRIELRCRLPAEAPALVVDPRLFSQILLNLVTNAVKFTPSGGSVEIDARPAADGGFEMVVRDTGIGMAATDIPRAQQPFVQLDSGLARRFEGAGLGLSIVRTFVELHGGRLDIASAPERGTTVTVWLPPERVRDPVAS